MDWMRPAGAQGKSDETPAELFARERQQRRLMGLREKQPPQLASARAYYDYHVRGRR